MGHFSMSQKIVFNLNNYALFLDSKSAPPAHTIAPKTAIMITWDAPVFGDVSPVIDVVLALFEKKATGDKELNLEVTVPSPLTVV